MAGATPITTFRHKVDLTGAILDLRDSGSGNEKVCLAALEFLGIGHLFTRHADLVLLLVGHDGYDGVARLILTHLDYLSAWNLSASCKTLWAQVDHLIAIGRNPPSIFKRPVPARLRLPLLKSCHLTETNVCTRVGPDIVAACVRKNYLDVLLAIQQVAPLPQCLFSEAYVRFGHTSPAMIRLLMAATNGNVKTIVGNAECSDLPTAAAMAKSLGLGHQDTIALIESCCCELDVHAAV